jgi:hypothetical protein
MADPYTPDASTSYVAPLFEGPLDIVGDVHGEYEVLARLLAHLGYDADGISGEGRRLVFLGDLIDRGPDSPAVVDAVMSMVERGVAQCVMGNHELNILLGRPLPGNGWFIQPNSVEKPGEFHSRRVDPGRIDPYMEFFATLPFVLESESLRLVHACWHTPSISRLRRDMALGLSVTDLYREYEIDVRKKLHEAELAHMVEEENMFYSVALDDPEWSAEVLPAHAEAEIIGQMGNPIRVVTTGAVNEASKPTFAMGSWRMADRSKWWDSYTDDVPVIIGHFWRRFDNAADRISGVSGRDIFDGIPSHAWMGNKKNVYCVDYSVGQLHKERQLDSGADEFHGKLAALRFPEWEVHHDDGTVIPIGS